MRGCDSEASSPTPREIRAQPATNLRGSIEASEIQHRPSAWMPFSAIPRSSWRTPRLHRQERTLRAQSVSHSSLRAPASLRHTGIVTRSIKFIIPELEDPNSVHQVPRPGEPGQVGSLRISATGKRFEGESRSNTSARVETAAPRARAGFRLRGPASPRELPGHLRIGPGPTRSASYRRLSGPGQGWRGLRYAAVGRGHTRRAISKSSAVRCSIASSSQISSATARRLSARRQC